MRIVVCDVGIGNLRSVERALLEAGRGQKLNVEITDDASQVRSADLVVMPGQGAFGDCVRGLERGIGDAVRDHLRAQRPYLGICMGLQVLFGQSDEAPGCMGLGIFEGSVVRLRGGKDAANGSALKIPHMGWNTAEPTEGNRGLLPPGDALHFYFMNSFVVAPRDPRVIAATTEYGERFTSAVAAGNLFGCQFHPEKSQRAGQALLKRFLAS